MEQKPINWTLIFLMASFVFGFAVSGFLNYMSYTNKVDLLSAEVKQLTDIIGEMNKKLDRGNDNYFELKSQVSLDEARINELEKKEFKN